MKKSSILKKDKNYYGQLPKQNLWDNPYKFSKKNKKFYHDTLKGREIKTKLLEDLDRKKEHELRKS